MNKDNDISIKLDLIRKDLMKQVERKSDNLYAQLESMIHLKSQMSLKGHLPALRGWAASPDLLLKLHDYILKNKPIKVVEFGCGATTLVIADALRTNGFGKLYSFEHLEVFSNSVSNILMSEYLSSWVELKFSPLVEWLGDHINKNEKPLWYNVNDLISLESVDLAVVDGPPGATCNYARYPAVEALMYKFSNSFQIWMDDANRKDETEIYERWKEKYNLELEYFRLEKGLCVLSKC